MLLLFIGYKIPVIRVHVGYEMKDDWQIANSASSTELTLILFYNKIVHYLWETWNSTHCWKLSTVLVIIILICFVSIFCSFQLLINCLFFIVSHFIFFSEDSFPRLGSMIVDYENPLKKIAEQFVPHQQVRLFLCTCISVVSCVCCS